MTSEQSGTGGRIHFAKAASRVAAAALIATTLMIPFRTVAHAEPKTDSITNTVSTVNLPCFCPGTITQLGSRGAMLRGYILGAFSSRELEQLDSAIGSDFGDIRVTVHVTWNGFVDSVKYEPTGKVPATKMSNVSSIIASIINPKALGTRNVIGYRVDAPEIEGGCSWMFTAITYAHSGATTEPKTTAKVASEAVPSAESIGDSLYGPGTPGARLKSNIQDDIAASRNQLLMKLGGGSYMHIEVTVCVGSNGVINDMTFKPLGQLRADEIPSNASALISSIIYAHYIGDTLVGRGKPYSWKFRVPLIP
jgi:hypothetical protein